MTYALLTIPHANRRYLEATRVLALTELRFLAAYAGVDASTVRHGDVGGLPVLLFEADELDEKACQAIRAHSAAQVLFCVRDGALRPLMDTENAYLPVGMGGILKYKGKTNEQFCTLLLNAAVFHSAFAAQWRAPLQLFDPLCGRGTLMYQALARGYNATGMELVPGELHEARVFVRNFLEYHKLKHELKDSSLSGAAKRGAPVFTFTLAPTREAWKAGDMRALRFVRADAREADKLFRPDTFHVIAADLPYGVQHAGADDPSAEALLRASLPAWKRTLKTGGAMALSFNSYTLPFERAVCVAREAGLSPAPYAEDDFSHWVEQAIQRNVLICTKD